MTHRVPHVLSLVLVFAVLTGCQSDGAEVMEQGPTIKDVREMSGDSLAKTLYVVTSRARSVAAVKEGLADHRAYLRKLEDSGALFAAGPLMKPETDFFAGDGLLIYRADSLEAARTIADGDPLHQSGAREYSIRTWLLNDGKITVTVRLSSPERDLP